MNSVWRCYLSSLNPLILKQHHQFHLIHKIFPLNVNFLHIRILVLHVMRQTDQQTDEWRDRHTARQTDRKTNRQSAMPNRHYIERSSHSNAST